MKRVVNVLGAGWRVSGLKIMYNHLPKRGLKGSVDIKWVRPEKYPFYHPSVTGDLAPMAPVNENTIIEQFKENEALNSVDESVRKTYSLAYQSPLSAFLSYRKEMIDRVKRHPLDEKSSEVRIAKMTAQIRWYQTLLEKKPKTAKWRVKIKELIDKRRKRLRLLRLSDYPKFEWLLEKLDLEYRPCPSDRQVTRKKSLTLLAKLILEKKKEEAKAALRESLDEQKVPFFEKKVKKLKWIKEMETKHNLTPTVTDADIDECIKTMEKVKIEVAERKSRGYLMKIHPYTLEAYDEKTLLEKERKS